MKRLKWFRALESVANLVLILSALVGAVGLSWWGHSSVHFGYPVLYETLAIDEHIAEYAPQNRYRDGFAATSRAERLALFEGIVHAINRGGRGLVALRYQPAPEADPVPLLREPEVTHLRAVAGVVTVLNWAGAVALVAFGITGITMRLTAMRLWRTAPLLGLGMVLALALMVVVAGLDTRDDGWFAWGHNQLFGADHQWFFYYEDSLMTTLFKAPDLFAPIAVSLALVAVVAASLMYGLARWLLPRR